MGLGSGLMLSGSRVILIGYLQKIFSGGERNTNGGQSCGLVEQLGSRILAGMEECLVCFGFNSVQVLSVF